MAGAYYRLTDLIAPVADTTQRIEDAIDVLAYSTLIFQLRKPGNNGAGTIVIQHAPILEEAAFVDTTLSFSITAGPGTYEGTLLNPMRFLRYSCTNWAAGDQIIIDVIARDN